LSRETILKSLYAGFGPIDKKTKWVSPAKILGFEKIITEEGKKFFKDTRELELYLKDADLCYAIVPRETGKLD